MNRSSDPRLWNIPGERNASASFLFRYSRAAAVLLGIVQVLLGFACYVYNSVLLIIFVGRFHLFFVAYGVWSGIVFYISGLLELLSGCLDLNENLIFASMVASLVSALFGVLVFALGVAEAETARRLLSSAEANLEPYTEHSFRFGVVMSVLAVAEVIASVVSSVLCWRAVSSRWCRWKKRGSRRKMNSDLVFADAIQSGTNSGYPFVNQPHAYYDRTANSSWPRAS